MRMVSKTGADVVIAGTGIVGCLIAEQMLDAGLSVLMLEAGPRIDRGRIIENYRNMGSRQDWRHGVHQLGQKGNTAEDPHISEGSDRALDRLSNSVVDELPGHPGQISRYGDNQAFTV
jgi:choline dehydrogenase-like flavoprotein